MRRQIVSAADATGARVRTRIANQPDVSEAVANTTTSDVLTVDDYKDKLLKLIPAEAIAVYLTLDGIIRSQANGNSLKVGLWIAFLLGLLGTPSYLWRLQGVKSPLQLTVSTASFAVWVFGLGGVFALYGWFEPWIASVVLVGYTFLVPLFLGKSPSNNG